MHCPVASACSRMSIATISVRFDGPDIPTPGLSQHNPGAASNCGFGAYLARPRDERPKNSL